MKVNWDTVAEGFRDDIAIRFWGHGGYSQPVVDGYRLDRALPGYLVDIEKVEFESDLDIAAFYAVDGEYDRIREAVLQHWPRTEG